MTISPDRGAGPDAAPGDRGWWLDANRTWHRGTPPPGWWQAHDGLWHPPAAEPIPLPPYAEPYWEPTQDTAEMADMDIADRTETADVDDHGCGEPPPALGEDTTDQPLEAVGPRGSALPAAPPDGGNVTAQDVTEVADDVDDPTVVDATVPGTYDDGEAVVGPLDTEAVVDDVSPRHMAATTRSRRRRDAGDGADDDDDGPDSSDDPDGDWDDDDWDDGGIVPAWAKFALPLSGVICAFAFLAVALAPGSDADSDDTRTDEPMSTSSTSTTASTTSAGAPSTTSASAPSTTTTPGAASPSSSPDGQVPTSADRPVTTAPAPSPSTAPPPPPSSTAPVGTPPPATNTPQPDPNCEVLGLPVLCDD